MSQVLEHHARCQNSRYWIGVVFAGELRGASVDRLEQRHLTWVNIPRGSHTQAALQTRPEVGYNVSEEIVGYNHVKPRWIQHHPHRQHIYIQVIGLDLGVPRRYFSEDPLPKTVTIR